MDSRESSLINLLQNRAENFVQEGKWKDALLDLSAAYSLASYYDETLVSQIHRRWKEIFQEKKPLNRPASDKKVNLLKNLLADIEKKKKCD